MPDKVRQENHVHSQDYMNEFESPPTHTTYCIYWVALQVQMDSKVDLPRCDDFFLCIENDANFIMLIFALPELRFNRLYNT